MRRKNVNNTIIRDSLTEALLILMKQKPFEQISVTELTEKAGVGRVSFYRCFESKEDILTGMLDQAAIRWWEQFNAQGRTDYVRGIFEHILTIKEEILLIYKRGLTNLIWINLEHLLGPLPDDDLQKSYEKAALTGFVYGILTEWIERGMMDTPEAMSHVFENINIPKIVERFDSAQS